MHPRPVGRTEGIAAGITNTNYFVTTTQGRYVLTLFETLKLEELPYYLNLMSHLARHGVACPAPMADRSDRFVSLLAGEASLPGVLPERRRRGRAQPGAMPRGGG